MEKGAAGLHRTVKQRAGELLFMANGLTPLAA